MARKKPCTEKSTRSKKGPAKPKTLEMDDVYRLIHRAQVNRKEVSFTLSPDDAVTAHNILTDLSRESKLTFEKKEVKNRVSFTVYPGPDEPVDESANLKIDFFEDEVPEDGQIF